MLSRDSVYSYLWCVGVVFSLFQWFDAARDRVQRLAVTNTSKGRRVVSLGGHSRIATVWVADCAYRLHAAANIILLAGAKRKAVK